MKLHRISGSGTLHFDLYFLGQTGIVLAKDNQNFFTSEVINNLSTLRKSFTLFGSIKDNTVILAVWAGTQRCHAVTLVTIEGPVNFQRCT